MALKPDKTSPLPMSDGEICAMFRDAKSKSKQIQILAQCNSTSKGRILDILVNGGVEVTPSMVDVYGWEETKSRYYDREAAEAPAAPAPEEPETEAPEPRQLPAAAETCEPAPAPMTVGALRDQLFGLPEDATVLLNGSAPIRSVTYVRKYSAARGSTVSQVMIE